MKVPQEGDLLGHKRFTAELFIVRCLELTTRGFVDSDLGTRALAKCSGANRCSNRNRTRIGIANHTTELRGLTATTWAASHRARRITTSPHTRTLNNAQRNKSRSTHPLLRRPNTRRPHSAIDQALLFPPYLAENQDTVHAENSVQPSCIDTNPASNTAAAANFALTLPSTADHPP